MLPESIDSILINTGNLISCKELKRKTTQSPSEEVFDSVHWALVTWMKAFEQEKYNSNEKVTYINTDNVVTIDEADRTNLKLTVKVFLEIFDCEALKVAIGEALHHLNVSFIDSLILALPTANSAHKLSVKDIEPFWKVLEEYVHVRKVVTIGISDLDTGQLAELYQWAQVKPSVNQVNLESCCVMPPEMTAFAKENDIQLLTHNDPRVLLPQDMFKKAVDSIIPSPDTWKSQWIVRYSVVIKSRGIIQNKGYLLSACKTTKTVQLPSRF